MAKKQTRRSISVSKNTYERLKSYCETNGISMSQFVETRVGDYLGKGSSISLSPRPVPSASMAPVRPAPSLVPQAPAPQPAASATASATATPAPVAVAQRPVAPAPAPAPRQVREEQPSEPPPKLTAEQIFTF